MLLTLAHIGPRPGARDSFNELTSTYLERCSIFAKTAANSFKTEDALLQWLGGRSRNPAPGPRRSGGGSGSPATGLRRWGGGSGSSRTGPRPWGADIPVLLDSRGRQFTSEAFAAWLGSRRDEGTQHIVFAIGPADGWSDSARSHAHLLLSLGTFTLAHALARLVIAEQLYRACTILTGHPYHTGH